MGKKKQNYNIDSVMEDLVDVRHQLQRKTIDMQTVKATHTNVARMLGVIGKQLLHAKMMEEKPNIPFMKTRK